MAQLKQGSTVGGKQIATLDNGKIPVDNLPDIQAFPDGGVAGQVLKKTATGTEWSAEKDTTYTAGENITITDGVISATGGGSNEPITIISQHDIVKENGFQGYARVIY